MTTRIPRRLPRAIINALRHHGTVPSKRHPGPSVDEWDEEIEALHPKGGPCKPEDPSTEEN